MGCNICNQEKISGLLYMCGNCENVFCLNCHIKNKLKCCFCDIEISCFDIMFNGYNREIYYTTINRIVSKYSYIIRKYYKDIKYFHKCFLDWQKTQSEVQQMTVYYFNLVISMYVDEKLTICLKCYSFNKNCKNCEIVQAVKYLLNIFKGPLLDKLLSVLPDSLKTPIKCYCNELNCDLCNNNLYCKYCLASTKNHVCDSKLIQTRIKMCPGCKILVTKDAGCDDMYCVNCGTFFSWTRGCIRYDKPHNPDFTEYSDMFSIKDDLINEYTIDMYGCCNETQYIVNYIMSYDSYLLWQSYFLIHVKKDMIPRFLQQKLVTSILKHEQENLKISARSINIVKKLYGYLENYENIIKIISPSDHMYWCVVSYKIIYINCIDKLIFYK